MRLWSSLAAASLTSLVCASLAQPIAPLGEGTLCSTGCRHKDSDPLFPRGSLDHGCALSCSLPSGLYAPGSPGVRPTGNNRAFILLEPMEYQVGTSDKVITIPAGFVTDYASIPRPLWSLYSPHDQYSRAAIVHDYLYWAQLCTREQSDNLFLIAMKESKVPETTRNAVYLGVRGRGSSSWDDNGNERRANKPRVVPIKEKSFPPNWSWEMYRDYLIAKGVKDPVFAMGAFCALGDSTEVPEGNAPDRRGEMVEAPRGVERAASGRDEVHFKLGPLF